MRLDDGAHPLQLGLPPLAWLTPFTARLREISAVRVRVDSVAALQAALAAGALDAALLPPITALQQAEGRILPGWGFSLTRETRAFSLMHHAPLDTLKTLYLPEDLRPWLPFIESVLQASGLNAPPKARTETPPRLHAGEGCLLLALEAAPALPEAAAQLDLNAWWWAQAQTPLVLLLWQGRFRAPYPALRRTLHGAFQQFEALEPPNPALDYRLASAASEGLTHLTRLAKQYGYAPENAMLSFC